MIIQHDDVLKNFRNYKGKKVLLFTSNKVLKSNNTLVMGKGFALEVKYNFPGV